MHSYPSKKSFVHLFQKFSRAKDANKANILGIGLGLYVAHLLVEAQHGCNPARKAS